VLRDRARAGQSVFELSIFFRAATRAVFAFGFAKNTRGNMDDDDEADLKKVAKLTPWLTAKLRWISLSVGNAGGGESW